MDCPPKPICKPVTTCPPKSTEAPVECLMDLVPYPEGCWKDLYDRNQQKYNLVLLFGIVNFIVAVTAVSKKLQIISKHVLFIKKQSQGQKVKLLTRKFFVNKCNLNNGL